MWISKYYMYINVTKDMIYVLVIIVIGWQLGFNSVAAGSSWMVAPPPEVTRLKGVHPPFQFSENLYIYYIYYI